jgi:hypothetical protein
MSSIQNIQETIKELSVEELLTIIAAATAEAKKKAKIVVKAAPKKEAKEKKGSMPKGVIPPQLLKPRAYVDYTLADANKNGWEAFEISGQPIAASVEKDGAHVFEATGKPFNHKHAMSLSKIRKTTRPEFYEEFEAQYVEPVAAPVAESHDEAAKAAESDGEEKPVVSAVSASKPKKEKAAPKPKKTDEEKAAEKEAKKEAKKAEKKAEKKEAKKPEAPKEVVVDTWVPKTTDGKVYPRTIGGVVYFSNHLHQLWLKDSDGSVGDWAGVFLVSENRIDATAEEPMYD